MGDYFTANALVVWQYSRQGTNNSLILIGGNSMGLFGKKGNAENSIIGELAIVDPSDNQSNSDESTAKNESTKPSFKNTNPMNYGIQDAIELIRQLPNVDSDIVVSVVRKTLESTKIHVSEIITDAEQREAAIESRSEGLITKISDLEGQIKNLNAEISELNAEIDETTKVKNLLVGSIEKENVEKPRSTFTKQTPTKPATESPQESNKSTSQKNSQNNVKDVSIA